MGIDWVHERVERVHRRVQPSNDPAEQADQRYGRYLSLFERVYHRLQRICEQIDRIFHRPQWVHGHRLVL